MWVLLLLEQKRLELSESEERSYLTYALLKLLPVLRTINTEQQEELVMEAKLHGSLPVHYKLPKSMLFVTLNGLVVEFLSAFRWISIHHGTHVNLPEL